MTPRPSVSEDPDGYFRWFYDASYDPADMEQIATRWHEDSEILQLADLPGTRGTFVGQQGVADMLSELKEASENFSFTPERVLDLGSERYLVGLAAMLEGRGSGIVMEDRVNHLVTMRGERVLRCEVFLDWDEALAAAERDQ